MKKEKSYTAYVKNESIYSGILFIICGIVSFIGGFVENVFVLSLLAIVTATNVFTMAKSTFGKWEKADEMAQENINRAKARALDYMELVCCIFTTITITLFASVDLPVSLPTFLASVGFIFVGCSKLLTGILYKRYEEQ